MISVAAKNIGTDYHFFDKNISTSFSVLRKDEIQALMYQLNSFFIEYRASLNIPKHITFGTEIEFEEVPYQNINQNLFDRWGNSHQWISKEDKTITTIDQNNIGVGGEVASSIMRDCPADWKKLESVCELLRSQGATTSACTGGHIHIGKQAIGENEQHWYRFLKLWALYEKVIVGFSCGEYMEPRESFYHFASPIGMMLNRYLCEHKYTQLSYNEILEELKGYGKNNVLSCRYIDCGFNTIEIRSPNSTMEEIIWQNNINFFTKMLDALTKPNFSDELLDKRFWEQSHHLYAGYSSDQMFIKESLELCDFIFDNNYDKCCFLKQNWHTPSEQDPRKSKIFIKK